MSHLSDSLARDNRTDELCDRFEQQWLAGESPCIEDVLNSARRTDRQSVRTQSDASLSEIDRAQLLHELLLVELELRRSNGESPTAAEYETRFPDDAIVIAEAFAASDPDAGSVRVALHVDSDTVNASLNPNEETHVPADAVGRIANPSDDPDATHTFVSDRDTTPTSQGFSEIPGMGKRFGDYELLREIARGGMGVVYKARQTKLNRIVALKMIKSGELAGDEEIQRFHAEAEAAAKLDHPHIVPIYEVGEQHGQHFFSMGFVDGHSLQDRLKDGPLPAREAAALVTTLAEAVQYAHDKGIVHRDLKPANVLLSVRSDRLQPVEGVRSDRLQPVKAAGPPPGPAEAGHYEPKITDFGLAKNLTAADSGLTATGQIVGTPSYMPPEQARGDVANVGPLSDVYSLGAILYALLTGRPPFQAASVMETLKQVLEQEPVSPRVLNPAVDRDLETICLKALEKDAEKRYAAARGFAEDITRYLDGRPIVARPVSRWEHAWRWCRRNRMLASIGATALALLLTLAIGGPLMAARQSELRRLADDSAREANANRAKFELQSQRAEREAANAIRERDLARDELSGHRTTLQAYLGTIKNSKLLADPKFTELKQSLLTDALAHHERFVEKHRNDPRLAADVADALHTIGEISAQTPAMLGNAISAVQRELVIRQRLSEAEPLDVERLRKLSISHASLGHLFANSGRNADALTQFRRDLKLRQRIAGLRPGNHQHQADVAIAHYRIAGVLLYLSEIKRGLIEIQRAVEILGRIRELSPSADISRRLVAAYVVSAKFFRQAGLGEDSLSAIQKGADVAEKLNEQFPTAEHGLHLARTLVEYGDLFRWAGKTAEAVAAYGRAQTIIGTLRKSNPRDEELESLDGVARNNTGLAYLKGDQIVQAGEPLKAALAIVQRLADRNPTIVKHQRELSAAHRNMGTYYTRSKRRAEALRHLQEAIRIQRRIVDDDPGVYSAQVYLAHAHSDLADEYSAAGRPEDAFKEAHVALSIIKQLPELEAPYTRSNVAGIYHALGRLYEHHKKHREAIEAGLVETAIRERLVKEYPRSWRYRHGLADCYNNLANAYRFSGNIAKATEIIDKMIPIYERLAGENRINTESLIHVAMSYAVAASIRMKTTPEDSVLLSSKAIRLMDGVRQREPKNTRARLFSSQAYMMRATAQQKLGRHRLALPDFQQMFELGDSAMKMRFAGTVAVAMIRTGDHQSTMKFVSGLSGKRLTLSTIYDLACTFALCGEAVQRDETLPLERRVFLAENRARSSLRLLSNCASRGFFKFASKRSSLEQDPDLDPLRNRDDFQRFCRAQGVHSYVVAVKPRWRAVEARKPGGSGR